MLDDFLFLGARIQSFPSSTKLNEMLANSRCDAGHEMQICRCELDAARAMKIYAVTKKGPSMTMIIGVSARRH